MPVADIFAPCILVIKRENLCHHFEDCLTRYEDDTRKLLPWNLDLTLLYSTSTPLPRGLASARLYVPVLKGGSKGRGTRPSQRSALTHCPPPNEISGECKLTSGMKIW